MNVIKQDGMAFRIPETTCRIKANLSKDWGNFISGNCNINETNLMKANELGLLYGDYIEIALCWIENKVLTFEPHYQNEPFTEIWGFPVNGKLKEQFAKNATQLITFLLHRQSRDKLIKTMEEFSKDAFNSWVNEGMIGDINEYAQKKQSKFYFSKIFKFELKPAQSKDYGKYFYVETSTRNPETDIDKAALKVAQNLYDLQVSDQGFCQDKMLEENHTKCLISLGHDIKLIEESTQETTQETTEIITNNKKIKAGK